MAARRVDGFTAHNLFHRDFSGASRMKGDDVEMILVLWWFVGLIVAVAVHEAGHLLCAIVASIPIRLLSVGVGPLLLHGRVGSTRLELRLMPLSGFVSLRLVTGLRKGPQLLFLLGGILGNVALICLIAFLDVVGAVQKLPQLIRDGLGPLVFAQLFLIVVNLIPFRVKINGTRIASDGLQVLRLLRSSRTTASGYLAALDRYGDARLLRPSQAVSRIAQQLARSERWIDENIRRDVQEALLDELAQSGLTRAEEMLVLDALVTDGLLYGDPELRPRLDEWSLRALQLGPEVKTLLGSRGAVLVELGRYEDGKALLEKAAASHRSDSFGSVMIAIFLARAEHALGDAVVARRLITTARMEVETGSMSAGVVSLIKRTEAELGPA
jgi:Peptidase family M50